MPDPPVPDPLGTPLAKAPGVSAALAKTLQEAFGYRSVRDLLEHYPRRYLTRGELTDLAHAKKGAEVTLVGTVRNLARKQPRRNLRILEVRVADDSGAWVCTWFNQPWHAQKLTVGTVAAFSGRLAWKAGRLGMANPGYEVLREGDDPEGFANEVIPVYPATKEVSSGRIRRAVGAVLDRYGDVPDFVPEPLRRAHGLPDRARALEAIHRPSDRAEATRARDRLVYDELFVLQVGLALRRRAQEAGQHGQPLQTDGDLTKRLLASLPYQLTGAQSRVMAEIGNDLARTKPMHRLLQGEVGSGKAQPIHSLVLTPSGFKRMGAIDVGDEVVNPTGEITVVTGVFPQGLRDTWRVVLSDGTSVECDDEHLWLVKTSGGWHRGDPAHVKTTQELRGDLTKRNGSSKWYIPVAAPVELECGEERPLDPYLLGLLLGDGSLRADQDDPHPVAAALKRLGLRGARSCDKHVPRAYLVAPIKVRHAVLQGLLDTDGTLNARRGGNVTFLSASRQLAGDVQWLAASLGGVARLRPVTKAGKVYHLVSIRLPDDYPPFRLRRRADLLKPLRKYHHFRRAIRRIEYVGSRPVQCISVAHPNQLYVTDHFAVTHNTVVSLWALLCAVQSGMQGAIMAPTEVLADQHGINLRGLLEPLGEGGGLFGGPRVEVLTAATTGTNRQRVLEGVASGEVDLVVGTHALLSEGVEFQRLGVVVVDEQHRFGVHQRVRLREKGDSPHVLIMTATPIPRTLALTLYGDLDVSTLDELPPGRTPIATHVVADATLRERAYQRVREEVAAGHQAYVVCALKDESDKVEVRSAKAEAERLRAEVFPDLRVGLVYGDMPAREKEATMDRFRAGEVDVLVSTTVIEVGVDVPNATVMLIEDADRFGLSQLHQLRGRVGRGEAPGLCVLFADPVTDEGKARMEAIARTNDGFELANEDLRIRGEGTVFDARQSGLSDLKLARLIDDFDWVRRARADAFELVEADPELADPDHRRLRQEVLARLGDGRAEWLARG
ncbi:MAG TPA: helicase-related protein [Actinomycetota bacterium]|nr:helicase-related protein [Actinomycetota bacterium]